MPVSWKEEKDRNMEKCRTEVWAASLPFSFGAKQQTHQTDTCKDVHEIMSFMLCSQELHPFVKWAVIYCST